MKYLRHKTVKTAKLTYAFNNRARPFNLLFYICAFFLFAHLTATLCPGVTSRITTHTTAADLLEGESENVVTSSQGTIQLGLAAETIAEEIEDIWSINSIVATGGAVYIGTSPNGGIYQYSLGELEKIYPADSEETQKPAPVENDPNDPNVADVNTIESQQYLTNEHIFAMASDVAGRLLAGVSGRDCKLIRFDKGKVQTVFEPNDANYIFAIEVAPDGDIYLGTGPNGKIYHLNSFANFPRVIFETTDKNILSLAVGTDGTLYAGTDTRGLVYKIDPQTKAASVLYDSEQQEITSLLIAEDGDLYAAATSARVKPTRAPFVAQLPLAGRPDDGEEKGPDDSSNTGGGLKLNIANTKKNGSGNTSGQPPMPPKGTMPGKNSYIYKITPTGYVTEVFTQSVVLFSMTQYDKKLFVGTGNNAELFTVDPDNEEEAIVYTDPKASQIAAVTNLENKVYLGSANPAKLITLVDGFAKEGTYTSDLIDAGQPTKWGKLQIEADIPDDCQVLMSCRSGNVKDPNDPTYSKWTEPVAITKPLDLLCPVGRFCQYKLILKSPDGQKTPVIREVAVADTVPNLAPKVESVEVARLEAPAKTGFFNITYKARDDNNDKLIYKIDFRKLGRGNWIELKDEIDSDNFEWDGKTVEDGRYEIKVTADDVRANTTESALSASRISEVVVVDNTAPEIKNYSIDVTGDSATLKMSISDQLSVIANVHYTIDSSDDWTATIPDDLVYDTTDENFTITTEKMEPGEHVLSIKIADAVGNTAYKTFEVNIK